MAHGTHFLTCTWSSRYEEFLSWCLPPQQNEDKPPQLLGLVPTSASFTVSMRVCSWHLYMFMFTCILQFFVCFANLMSWTGQCAAGIVISIRYCF